MTESDLIQALVSAVASRDDVAAEVAAQALAGKTYLLPALRPLLADVDPNRRWWAIRSLALVGGDDAGRLLIEGLADPDESTRCAAALGLGELRFTQAIAALVGRLADESGWVRDSAADALAMLGALAVAALTEALADHRDGVRVRAASALRRILVSERAANATEAIIRRHLASISALFLALNDPNRLVRHNAYQALDRLGLLETVFAAP